MNPTLVVTNFKFNRASVADQRRGLIGYIRVVLNGALLLDGIALRRTTGNRLTLSYPARLDARGHRHPYAQPCEHQRAEFERQLFEALEFKSEGSAP